MKPQQKYALHDVRMAGFSVAAHFQTPVDVAAVAGKHRAETNYAFLQEYQSLGGLKLGARRIGCHYGAVKQRLVAVVDKLAVVLAAVAPDEQ